MDLQSLKRWLATGHIILVDPQIKVSLVAIEPKERLPEVPAGVTAWNELAATYDPCRAATWAVCSYCPWSECSYVAPPADA